jgi:hypothetical protein
MIYSIAAALISIGIAILPIWVLRPRQAGTRRGAFATRPAGIPLYLDADQGRYRAVARLCYRLPRGPLVARFRCTLLDGTTPVWATRVALEEPDVSRGTLVERQVDMGVFDIQRDGDYVLKVEPEAAVDPRVQIASVELFAGLPRPHPIALAASQVLIVSGLAAIALRSLLP